MVGSSLAGVVETTLAARQPWLRPAWALGSVGSIGRSPVINGVGYLKILWRSR